MFWLYWIRDYLKCRWCRLRGHQWKIIGTTSSLDEVPKEEPSLICSRCMAFLAPEVIADRGGMATAFSDRKWP